MAQLDGSNPVSLFCSLPEDCQLDVLKYLSLNDRIRLDLACKLIANLNDRLWASQRVLHVVFKSRYSSRQLVNCGNFCRQPTHRTFESDVILVRDDSMDNQVRLLEKCANLVSLSWLVPSVADFGLQLANLCPNLRHLIVTDLNPVAFLFGIERITLNCLYFYSFRDTLYGSFNLRSGEEAILVNLIKQLTSLRTFLWPSTLTKDLLSAIRTINDSLQHLAFSSLSKGVQKEELAVIAGQLRSLSTSEEIIFPDLLIKLVNLQNLEISRKRFIYSELDLQNYLERRGKELVSLELTDGLLSSQTFFASLVNNCPNLTELSLTGSAISQELNNLSDQDCAYIARLTKLRRLSLNNLRFNFMSFSWILKCTVKLNHIEIKPRHEAFGSFYWNAISLIAKEHPKRAFTLVTHFKHPITSVQKQNLSPNLRLHCITSAITP